MHVKQDVNVNDAGSYQVQLTSVVPPNNHIIYFEVDVISNPAKGFLIGLICVAVYAVGVSLVAIGQYFTYSKKLSKKGKLIV